MVADTVVEPYAPLPFRNRYLLRTQYLDRIFQQAKPQVAVAPEPEPDTTATTYALRYSVSLELATQILSTARAEGIDPDLGFRLIRVESRFQPRARGPAGALGLTQLMPGTARGVDPSLRTEADVLEPKNNLRVGFRYLRGLLEMFDGDVRLALLAYNRGEGTVARALKRGADPENGYSRKVLGARGGVTYKGKGLLPRLRSEG